MSDTNDTNDTTEQPIVEQPPVVQSSTGGKKKRSMKKYDEGVGYNEFIGLTIPSYGEDKEDEEKDIDDYLFPSDNQNSNSKI